MKLHHCALAAVCFAVTLGNARADTLEFDSNVLPVQMTNWSGFLDLPQFDSGLGTLQSVTIELFGNLAGTAKAESRNNTAATVTLNLQATLKLANPNDLSSILVQTTPLVQQAFQATSYDGSVDFAGTSGATYAGLQGAASQSATFSDAATLSLFTGPGFVHAPLHAAGASNYTGPGNVWTSFRTEAGAHARVSYAYLGVTTPVPEPTTWALMLAGLGAVALMASRRRQR